jgi:hypothetical protein
METQASIRGSRAMDWSDRRTHLLLAVVVAGSVVGCEDRPGSAPPGVLVVEAGGGRLDRWIVKQQENCDPEVTGEAACLEIETLPAVPADQRESFLACRVTGTAPPAEEGEGGDRVREGGTVTVEVAADTTPDDPGDDRELCGLGGEGT